MRRILQLVVALILVMPPFVFAAPVHDAVKAGDIKALKALLSAGPEDVVNAKAKGSSTPLHWAATWNVPDAARVLIKAGADLEAPTDNGARPLHWAAYRDSLEVATLLIKSGVDMFAVSSKGFTPLHWAAIGDAPEVAQMLIDQGVPVNGTSATGGLTPLHCAIRKGNRDVLPVLLRNGGDLYIEAVDGSKPISWIKDAEYRAYLDEVLANIPADDKGAAESVRRLEFPDGSRYEGMCRGDVMQGRGTMTFPDGARYIGDWNEGAKEGLGIYEYPGGERYEGNWLKGARSGDGRYSYQNGGVLEGLWEKSKFVNGTGTYMFADGDKYDGQWRDNMMWGLGTYTTGDGQVFRGYWDANEFVAPAIGEDAETAAP